MRQSANARNAGPSASTARSASSRRLRTTSPRWSRCFGTCGACSVPMGRAGLIAAILSHRPVAGPPDLARLGMYPHMAPMAQHNQVIGRLIPFLAVFVMDVESRCRAAFLTRSSTITNPLCFSGRQTVIPGIGILCQHRLTAFLSALRRPPFLNLRRHLRASAGTAITVTLACLCLAHRCAMLGCALVWRRARSATGRARRRSAIGTRMLWFRHLVNLLMFNHSIPNSGQVRGVPMASWINADSATGTVHTRQDSNPKT
jgi:hypothetical protein